MTLQRLKPARPWRKIYKYIIYAVPTFANPSTKIMSLHHREQLVRIARKYDALLVTDDVYDCLQWSAIRGEKAPEHACMPRLVDIDRYLDGGLADEWGHAISNGSFSKLIGPGARTGWAESTEKVAFGLSQVYVFPPPSAYLEMMKHQRTWTNVTDVAVDRLGLVELLHNYAQPLLINYYPRAS